MTQYVYLLSHYGEHGSEDVKATLDRSKLALLLDRLLAEHFKNWVGDEIRAALQNLLQKPDAELAAEDQSPHGLTEGWGGVQLHVVEVL